MKKKITMASWSLIIGLMLTSISFKSFSQGSMTKMCNLTATESKSKFNSLAGLADFKLLQAQLSVNGFSKINSDDRSYGFTGTYFDSLNKKSSPVEFYAFDYFNRSTNQYGSIIWRNNGVKTYKAYLIFAAGEKDFEKGLESATEMFVDANGKIQKASSWRSCFIKSAKNKCGSFCFGAVIYCASGMVVPGAGVAAWIACAGVACGLCFAVSALSCL
jgi:hypothetical protein